MGDVGTTREVVGRHIHRPYIGRNVCEGKWQVDSREVDVCVYIRLDR